MSNTTPGSLTLSQRVQLPTPPFFQKLRTIGIVLATVSCTLAAAPVALPVVIAQAAGYLALAGAVITAVSQTAVNDNASQQVTVTGFARPLPGGTYA
jgi:hypothetical protein